MSTGTETTLPLPGVESSAEEQEKAAVQIQRHYRGHRERRELKGLGLTPNQRWGEAWNEAHCRQATSRGEQHLSSSGENDGHPSMNGARRVSGSREKWQKAVLFARQVQHDDEPSSSSSDDGSGDEETRKKRREEKRAKRRQIRKERMEYSKAMDMQYFLEMVDLKHRYGANLRAYHAYWQSQPTLENFFYWLDYGAGRTVDLSICPRTQLNSECVRYLSREERQSYLVKIDKEGRLCWAKNGERIDTTEKYRDSAAGIVPVGTEDTTSATSAGSISHEQYSHHHARRRSNTAASRPSTKSSSDPFSSSGSSMSGQSDVAKRHANPVTQDHRSVNKVFHVSASTVLNRLLRGTTKKNTWIFVVDNSFRLYVGIKQNGTFQHSSFLHGARVSAAGLIKIKDGRLTSLSPLSGHYRPPTNNFRKFVESLKEANVDMSHVSISKSYAILVGLEAYSKFRKGKGRAKRATKDTAGKVAGKTLPSDMVRTLKDKGEEKGQVREQYQLDKPTHYSADGVADKAQIGPPDRALKRTISIEGKKRDENNIASRFMKKLHLRPRLPETAAGVEGKAKQ